MYKYNYFSRDRFWTRYTTDNPTNQVFVVDNEDVSPQWPHWEYGDRSKGYDPECSACWLGMSHSTDYHNRKNEEQN